MSKDFRYSKDDLYDRDDMGSDNKELDQQDKNRRHKKRVKSAMSRKQRQHQDY